MQPPQASGRRARTRRGENICTKNDEKKQPLSNPIVASRACHSRPPGGFPSENDGTVVYESDSALEHVADTSSSPKYDKINQGNSHHAVLSSVEHVSTTCSPQ